MKYSGDHGDFESDPTGDWTLAKRIRRPHDDLMPDLERVRRVQQRFFDAYVAVDELADNIVRFGFPQVKEDLAEQLTDASEHQVYGESLVRLYSALVFGHTQHRMP